MNESTNISLRYPNCSHIKREKLNIHIPEDLLNELVVSDSLPEFEKRIQDYKQMKRSSLHTNQLLKCRWSEFTTKMGMHVVTPPFRFPETRDNHFVNFLVRHSPNESISKREDQHNYKLRPGPGVDNYGQMPIPSDMHCARVIDRKTLASVRPAKMSAGVKKTKKIRNGNGPTGDIEQKHGKCDFGCVRKVVFPRSHK